MSTNANAEVTTDQLLADLKTVMNDAEALLRATSTQTGEKIQEVRARAEESLRQAKQRLSSIEDEALRRAREVADATDEYVRENPWQSVGIAAGVGLLVGLLLAGARVRCRAEARPTAQHMAALPQEQPQSTTGLFQSLSNFAGSLIAIAHTRLQLLTTELQEEVRQVGAILLWAFIAAFTALLASVPRLRSPSSSCSGIPIALPLRWR